MSAMGGRSGQVSQEVILAIREAVRELDGFRRAAGESSRATDERTRKERGDSLTNNFVTNGTALAGRRFGRDAGFGIAEEALQGFDMSASVVANAIRAGSAVPVIGQSIFGPTQNALEEAGNRTLGVLGPIARAGGTIADEDIDAMMGLFKGQGDAAQALARRVQNRQNLMAEQTPMGQGVEAVLQDIPKAIFDGWKLIADDIKRAWTGPAGRR